MEVDQPAVVAAAVADTTATTTTPSVTAGAPPTLGAGAPAHPDPARPSSPTPTRRRRPGWAKPPRLLFGINEVTRAAEGGSLAAAVIDRGAPLVGVLAAHLPALCYIRQVPLAAFSGGGGKGGAPASAAEGAAGLAGVTGMSRVLAVGVARARQAPGEIGGGEADAAVEAVVRAVEAAAPVVSYAWLDGLRAQLPGGGEAPV